MAREFTVTVTVTANNDVMADIKSAVVNALLLTETITQVMDASVSR